MYVSELLPAQTKKGDMFFRCELGASPDLGRGDRVGSWKQPEVASVRDC